MKIGGSCYAQAVRGHADECHGATLLGQVCQRPLQGNVCLRLLRCQALRRQQQVRVGNRLAQLLEAGERRPSIRRWITASLPRHVEVACHRCKVPTSVMFSRTVRRPRELRYCMNSGRAFSGVGARRSHSTPRVEPHAVHRNRPARASPRSATSRPRSQTMLAKATEPKFCKIRLRYRRLDSIQPLEGDRMSVLIVTFQGVTNFAGRRP